VRLGLPEGNDDLADERSDSDQGDER
jgi:hypothetical protein